MTISLRPVEEDDLPFIHRLVSDPGSTGEFQWYGYQTSHRLRERWSEHGIEAGTELTNVAEQRALEKAGFTREGVMRGVGFRAGQWRDGVRYSILRSDLGQAATGA